MQPTPSHTHIHVQSDEPDTPEEPKMDNTTNAKEEWEKINPSISTQTETPIFPRNGNADSVVNATELLVGRQDQKDIQKQSTKEDNWRPGKNYRTTTMRIGPKFVNILLEFQQMWDRHLCRARAAKHRIELNSAAERPIHSAP